MCDKLFYPVFCAVAYVCLLGQFLQQLCHFLCAFLICPEYIEELLGSDAVTLCQRAAALICLYYLFIKIQTVRCNDCPVTLFMRCLQYFAVSGMYRRLSACERRDTIPALPPRIQCFFCIGKRYIRMFSAIFPCSAETALHVACCCKM